MEPKINQIPSHPLFGYSRQSSSGQSSFDLSYEAILCISSTDKKTTLQQFEKKIGTVFNCHVFSQVPHQFKLQLLRRAVRLGNTRLTRDLIMYEGKKVLKSDGSNYSSIFFSVLQCEDRYDRFTTALKIIELGGSLNENLGTFTAQLSNPLRGEPLKTHTYTVPMVDEFYRNAMSEMLFLYLIRGIYPNSIDQPTPQMSEAYEIALKAGNYFSYLKEHNYSVQVQGRNIASEICKYVAQLTIFIETKEEVKNHNRSVDCSQSTHLSLCFKIVPEQIREQLESNKAKLKLNLHYCNKRESERYFMLLLYYMVTHEDRKSWKVITGKGNHSPENKPILKPFIQNLLKKVSRTFPIEYKENKKGGGFDIWKKE